jgi:2-polyprenyl-6-methoxyphenol hydroxylase-like FAD-dependent oxidoreductase
VRRKRAIIIGGSMSGLFSAAFLRRIGWDVDVYERSAVELVGRGAGITSHPELFDALIACGAGTKDLGVEVEKRITIDRNGRVTPNVRCGKFSPPGTACSVFCAPPSTKRIIISAGISSASTRTSAACS